MDSRYVGERKQWGIAGTLVPDRGQWRPFLCRVSFPVWLACLAEALARLFLQFPFSPFFTSSLSPVGRGRWVRGFSTEQNRPCVWPRRPHLPTPQHTCSQWGLCNSGPKPTPAFPPKTGNRDWPSSCFSTNFLLCCPFPRLFSLFFSGSSQVGHT